jgi:hypothetical protein
VRETDSPEEEFDLRREPSLAEKYDVPPETRTSSLAPFSSTSPPTR